MSKQHTRAQNRSAERKSAEQDRTVVIPKPLNPKRRKAAGATLWDFGQTYFKDRFYLEPAPIHRELADELDKRIKTGGMKAMQLPRGSAKTTWMEIGAIYAIVYGFRMFPVLVGGTGEMSEMMLERVRAEFEINTLLAEDFPEVCLPIIALEGSPQRAKSMLADIGDGELHPIGFEWKNKKVVFPRVPGSKCGGAVIVARGIEGNLRGLIHKMPDGKTVRPDLVLVDDAQTRESAGSPKQCQDRLSTINGDLVGLAGPRKKISVMVAGTIIKRGDVIDQLTDKKLYPSWDGMRCPMVIDWPEVHETMWLKEYADLRRDGQRNGDKHARDATAFYLANREAMDKDAVHYWPARFNDDEVSAIQNAYNLLIDIGEADFYAEYQGDPRLQQAIGWEITPEIVCDHLSLVPRGIVPASCEILSLAGDVNLYGINWALTAWTMDGAGYVIDWGKFPAGETPLWSAKTSRVTEEQAIFAGLLSVAQDVWVTRIYTNEASKERMRPNVLGYDLGFKRRTVYQALAAIRQIATGAQVLGVRGFSGRHYKPRQGERKGDGWHVGQYVEAKALCINADHWAERMQKAFLFPVGSPGGSIGLYGKDPKAHAILASHICADYVKDVLTGERMGLLYDWGLRPGQRNDLGDAMKYSVAGASFMGVQFAADQKIRRADVVAVGPAKPPAPAADVVEKPKVPPQNYMQQMAARRHGAMRGRRGSFATSW